jgi:hypothetical protein
VKTGRVDRVNFVLPSFNLFCILLLELSPGACTAYTPPVIKILVQIHINSSKQSGLPRPPDTPSTHNITNGRDEQFYSLGLLQHSRSYRGIVRDNTTFIVKSEVLYFKSTKEFQAAEKFQDLLI